MKTILILIFVPLLFIKAQSLVMVPEEILFAGMRLKLTSGARKEIETDIAAITKNQKFFSQIIDRANLYFPIIEKIFEEENFPEDFKYLALQESCLMPDVVSSSKAVGYWQFKKETALEVGLRVDRDVDERMNIYSSTRGATRYLKKNNNYLDNWIYTLLAYNLGRGGVAPHVKEKYRGSIQMEIDKGMHWYVLRFLAHKIAYENLVGKYPHPELSLHSTVNAGNRTLEEVSEEFKIPLEDLRVYNKWLLQSRIPDDKIYTVVMPVKLNKQEEISSLLEKFETNVNEGRPEETQKHITYLKSDIRNLKQRLKKDKDDMYHEHIDITKLPSVITYNKLKAIKARPGDNISTLAYAGKLDEETFLKRNDIGYEDGVKVNQYYYIEPKRNSGLIPFHTLQQDESLWSVSQRYGIRLNNIKRKNRIKKNQELKPGRVLWLQKKRPRSVPEEYKQLKVEVLPEKIIYPVPINKEKSVSESQNKRELKVYKTYKDSAKSYRDTLISAVINNRNDTSLLDYHTVMQRQTLYTLSKMYGTRVDSLQQWNNLSGEGLKPGTKIIVGKKISKNKVENPSNKKVYIVKSGDTIYKISRSFSVSVKDILNWNNKKDFAVSIGEEIVIMK